MDSCFLNAEFLRFSFYRKPCVASIPERKLSYLDLTFCLEGKMEYYYNEKKVVLGTGDAIATAVNLAPNYLCNLFKKHTGITVIDFIIEQRIDFAKRLMIAQDTPLFKISENCGFNDYNYFSKTFKKHTGTTAAKYKKMKQKIN